jgi:hypothetical protein
MPDIRPTSSEFDFKAVILLSTVHTDNKIDSDSGKLKKLEIIILYNFSVFGNNTNRPK